MVVDVPFQKFDKHIVVDRIEVCLQVEVNHVVITLVVKSHGAFNGVMSTPLWSKAKTIVGENLFIHR